jgi:choline kinase
MNNILPVILSAGMGTRLGNENKNQPKALLEISGKCLISYQLEKLRNIGFSEVLIVVGFKEASIKKILGDDLQGMTLHYVTNEDFSQTGTAYSFYKSQGFWSQNKPSILMLHSDIFYDLSLLDAVLLKPRKSVLVIDESYVNNTNDEMVVFAHNQNVYKIEKGPSEMQDAVGEVLGINLFSSSFCDSYFAFLESFFENNKNKKVHWEQTLKIFLENSSKSYLGYLEINQKLWVNINYSADLEYAKSFMYRSMYNYQPKKK